MIGKLAAGKRFLNLFAYTATATVSAALGGAEQSVSVDMSNTYLNWAERNFGLNQLDPSRHQLILADCLCYLETAATARDRFDLIFLDPPTFSNSKRMQDTLDIQRDHVGLIHKAMRLLSRDGMLVFSTNARKFKLDAATMAEFAIKDVTRATIPLDFSRRGNIHRCYTVRAGPPSFTR